MSLDLLHPKLVVYHTTQGDSVTKKLEAGDGGAPNCDRGADKEDIFEDTT